MCYTYVQVNQDNLLIITLDKHYSFWKVASASRHLSDLNTFPAMLKRHMVQIYMLTCDGIIMGIEAFVLKKC